MMNEIIITVKMVIASLRNTHAIKQYKYINIVYIMLLITQY